MPIWWRRARFSSSREARERKIEDRVARAVLKKMSIGRENYERSIIPLCSETSRFSRGTGWDCNSVALEAMVALQHRIEPDVVGFPQRTQFWRWERGESAAPPAITATGN